MKYYCLDFIAWRVYTSTDPKVLCKIVWGIFNAYLTKEDALKCLLDGLEPYTDPDWCGVEGYEDEVKARVEMINDLMDLK